MNGWRSKRLIDPDFEPKPQHVAEPETHAPEQHPVLRMQRDLGNRAVQKALPRLGGEPIADAEREQLESAYGRDLGDVLIHRDSDAAEITADAGAGALASGRDIYFAPGQYSSSTLAHEVGHVIQQADSSTVFGTEDASLEHQAESAARSYVAGHAIDLPTAAGAPAFQRQPLLGAQTSSFHLLPTDSVTLDAFDIDKAVLNAANKQKLEAFAKRLKATLASSPDSIITIVGFADAPGTEPHNLKLGQQRADQVRDYLSGLGIPPAMLHATSLGEQQPTVSAKGYEARNRRVEVDVMERSFFKASPPVLSPAPPMSAPAEKPKIDLTFHPNFREPTPDEEFRDRWQEIDKAVQEAKAEQAKQGSSISDLGGRILRRAAEKLGLPKWIQDRAESIGQDLPSKGATSAIDQLAGDSRLDATQIKMLKALVDALMRTKIK